MKKKTEIQVSKKYRLSSDKFNIILQEKYHNKKLNTIIWDSIAYFSTPQNALNYILEQEIREFWVEDLKEVVKRMDELYKMVRELPLDPVFGSLKGRARDGL